jgi:hypothetical protein
MTRGNIYDSLHHRHVCDVETFFASSHRFRDKTMMTPVWGHRQWVFLVHQMRRYLSTVTL